MRTPQVDRCAHDRRLDKITVAEELHPAHKERTRLAQGDQPVRAARARAASFYAAVCSAWTGAALAESVTLENIVVTGSRIERADLSGPSPVVSIPAEVFAQSGAISLERTLDLYPQVLATAGATSNNPSNDGQANVSLRGLGPNRTLVLLDGRRLMPADGNGSVDLNTIPPALVESVELMTGGASAVYGSDAIAGVVNVRLRQRFEGVELEGSTASTERGDGTTYSAGITAGTSFGGGAGSVMAYAGYASRAAIRQDERDFSAYPLLYVKGLTGGLGPGGSFLGSGSGITEEGINIVFSDRAVFNSVFDSYGYAPNTVPLQAGIGVNTDGTLFTTGNGAPGSVVNYRGDREAVLFNDRIVRRVQLCARHGTADAARTVVRLPARVLCLRRRHSSCTHRCCTRTTPSSASSPRRRQASC